MLQKNGQAEIPQMKLELADKSVLPLPVDKVYWDNEMDVQTATVNLYAEYENSDELLIPNDHLNVLWQNTQPKTVVMVPQTALYNDASGSYVMKLNGDNTVIQQYVTKGENIDGQIVIEDRLTAQDKIVVSGGQKLRNGQTIQPIETKAE
jgi:multidrug efflux pump subunit AcrA (membrane-fusion protein)